MPSVNFPTLETIQQRLIQDTKAQFSGAEQFYPASYFLALLQSVAGRFYEENNKLQELYNLLFFYTTSDEFLNEWGAGYGLTRKAATIASGQITITGTIGTLLSVGTVFVSSSGLLYTSSTEGNIEQVNIPVTLTTSPVPNSLVDYNAVATTPYPHTFATGMTVFISSPLAIEYQGNQTITVLDDLTFSYVIQSNPPQNVDGTAEAALANVAIFSQTTGENVNLASGAELTLQIPNPAVNEPSRVQIGGIIGGESEETDTAYRSRLIYRIQNPVANYSVSAITTAALSVAGVTRVKVYPVTNNNITPAPGYVTLFFLMDNTPGPITQSQIDTVYEAVAGPTIKPAQVPPENIIVRAPTLVLVDFVFTSLLPSTAGLQKAVSDNLLDFFSNSAEIGKSITQAAYTSVIYNTIDPNNGQAVTSFSLQTPITDITIDYDQIATLDNVSFLA
jgi:uncharacterized phage protein gp47/JayE